MKYLIVCVLSGISVVVQLGYGVFSVSEKVLVFMPLVYISASFYIFDKYPIGYRIFHHICLAFMALYYIFGLYLNMVDIYTDRGSLTFLSYSWFSSLPASYIFFLLMFFVSYFPYFLYRKIAMRSKA